MKTKILLLVLAMASLSSSLFSQKWIVQHSGLPASVNPTLIFSPVNPNVCWGIQFQTTNPQLVLTTNGGDNWSLMQLKGISGFQAQSIFALNADTAWITLDDPSGNKNGGIYKTNNGGIDWTRQETAYAGAGSHPISIYFFDSKNGLSTGLPNNGYWEIYTTSDGGTNWTRVPSASIPPPISGDWTTDLVDKGIGNSYWFPTFWRSVYSTTDRGLTWKVVRDIPSSNGVGADLAFKDTLNGLAISYYGDQINQLSATTDGGLTWSKLNYPLIYPSTISLDYIPGTSGTYVLTSHSNIGGPEPLQPGSAYTEDNGLHWKVIDNLAHEQISFTTGNVGWSAGTGDIIYKWVSDIIPSGSTVTKLSSDQFIWTRAAVWYDSALLFADDFLPGSGPNIYKFDPVSKQFSTWPTNSTHSSGLTCDRDGNLIGVTSKVIMMDHAGHITKILAAIYNDKPFNNPIDLIADKNGGVYFSDPDFFLTSPPQDKTAVYYIPSTGNIKRVIDNLAEPNGLVLSPDGKKLYAVDSENKYLYSWDVASDGSVSGKVSLAELQTTGVNAGAIGMTIDTIGNIYVATDIGIQVFSPHGDAITTIVIPNEHTTDCGFGGSDFKTLYITAYHGEYPNFMSNLYSIDLNYPGYAVSRKTSPNVGISQIPNKPMVAIYPNPVSDLLHVQLKTDKVRSFEILSMDGKTESVSLINKVGKDVEINTQNLKPGIYILRVVIAEGVVSEKFIKK
jgi:sugar lactone lactonase YvrE